MTDANSRLTDREHVRQRAAMYVGDTTSQGMHQLLFKIIENSIDEIVEGHASNVAVTLRADGSVRVEDDGRVVPVDRDERLSAELGRDCTALEGLMTLLAYKSSFHKHSTRMRSRASHGLLGVGMCVVNFLSEWYELETHIDQHVYSQAYRQGIPTGLLTIKGETRTTGTIATFKPDPEIFGAAEFDYECIKTHLLEQAYLNSPVRITLVDNRAGDNQAKHEEYCFKHGVADLVNSLTRHANSASAPTEIVHAQGEANQIGYEIAFGYAQPVVSFVNNFKTLQGGSHVDGFYAAFTSALNAQAQELGILEGLELIQSDYESHLRAVVSVREPNPLLGGNTRSRLVSQEAQAVLKEQLHAAILQHLKEHPYLVQIAVAAARARVG